MLDENRRLRGLLKPFANLYKRCFAAKKDDHPAFGIDGAVITVGDLRAAHAEFQAEGIAHETAGSPQSY